jgi:type IV secretory pathway VirJ component
MVKKEILALQFIKRFGIFIMENKKLKNISRSIFSFAFFTFLLISGQAAGVSSDSLNVPVFGKVYIYNRTNTPQNVIIMISGDGGWRSGVISFSETFSEMNSIVIGVDILQYFKELRTRTDECYNVATDFVQLITDVEKKYDFPDYKPPILMGYSSGASLVYGILAQSRPGTFIGGISIGFCPDIDLPKKLCEIDGLTVKEDIPGKRYLLQPDKELGNTWIVLNGQLDKICNYPAVVDFVAKTKNAELVTLPKVGHGFSKWNDFMPQWKDAFSRLLEKYEKDKPPLVNIDQVKSLPLIITNSKFQDKLAPFALLISGDGGWYGFEQSIADNLALTGIPTVGLDSKKYFWKRRTPEETAIDIAKALNFYSKEWGREKYVLVGYSLGAEIVPFIVNRLPDDMKSRVKSAVLMSPATTTDFEIHISNMLGMGNKNNTYNTINEIVNLHNIPTLIIFGDGEKTQIPELLAGKAVVIRKIPGDHHYKFNLPLIMQTMRENNAF